MLRSATKVIVKAVHCGACTMATKQEEDIQVLASTVLSRRYEEQLLKQASGHSKVVPALVITGFLGAGKTTLLQHLLASCGGELKLGVLVNEVASLDVDSQLLHAVQSNAAAGVKAARLAGGCACCAVCSDLDAALAELAGSSSYQQLDCLLLETSGVADAEPLAASLAAAGFKLNAVVVVVDAEAGQQVLQQDVAIAQVLAADIVVLNKCDLASLGSVAAVEDRVQELAPGVRMLRARYGQVPPEAVLDIDLPDNTVEEAEDNSSQHQPGVRGEVAFLSHEPVVSIARTRVRKKPVGLARQAQTPAACSSVDHQRTSSQQQQQQQQQQRVGHRSQHNHFVTVSFTSDVPLCMACFQDFTANTLLAAKDLFRAKGFAWFAQQRSQRYIFHLSGKQRVECGSEGAWLGPPGVGLVLIGQDAHQLEQVQQGLSACVVGNCRCNSSAAQLLGSTSLTAQQQQQQQCAPQQELMLARGGKDCALGHEQGSSAVLEPPLCATSAAARFIELVQQHHRFEIVQQQQEDSGVVAGASGLVQFAAVGSALHGVVADEVNASLLRRVNATAGMFMFHIKSPAALRAATGQHATYQGVKCLQTCFRGSAQARAADLVWEQLQEAVAGVLRKAYQHVHNCKCDAVGLQLVAGS